MDDDVKYDLIERYLADEMSDSERGDFEDQLKADADLQAELDLHRQVAETLKGEKIHDFRETLKKVDQTWKAPEVKKNGKMLSFPFRSVMTAAAVILALIVAWQFLSPKNDLSNEALFAAHFEPYKMILNQRSSPNTGAEASIDLEAAVNAYEKKDFKAASRLFQLAKEESTVSDVFELYIGVSDLSTGNVDKAIAIFEKAMLNPSPLFVEQTRWYLALAYLKKGEAAAAKIQLEQIESGAFQYATAQKILKAL